jgi:hypothetical protein
VFASNPGLFYRFQHKQVCLFANPNNAALLIDDEAKLVVMKASEPYLVMVQASPRQRLDLEWA